MKKPELFFHRHKRRCPHVEMIPFNYFFYEVQTRIYLGELRWDNEDFGKMRDAGGAGWCPRLLSVTWPSSAPLYLATEKHMIGLSSIYILQTR